MIDVPKIGCNISKHMYINLFITSCVCAWYLLVSIIHLALSANCVQLVYTELSAVIVYQVWRYGIWAKWPKFFLCKTSITFLFLCISRLKGRVISHKIYNLLTPLTLHLCKLTMSLKKKIHTDQMDWFPWRKKPNISSYFYNVYVSVFFAYFLCFSFNDWLVVVWSHQLCMSISIPFAYYSCWQASLFHQRLM